MQSNAVIAISLFMIILFVLTTINSFDNTLENLSSSPDSKIIARYKRLDKIQANNATKEVPKYNNTKISREQLGRAGWTLLHLISVNYPLNPTYEEKEKFKIFLQLFGEFYPCKECGGHFLDMLEENPIRAENQTDLVEYLCFLHNKVNVRLGKPTVECDKAAELWGGNCGCGEEPDD